MYIYVIGCGYALTCVYASFSKFMSNLFQSRNEKRWCSIVTELPKKCFNINPMPDSISLLTDQDCCSTFVCSFFVACTFFVCFDSTRMTPDILQRKLSRLNFHWYSILIHVQWAVADHRRMIPILNFNTNEKLIWLTTLHHLVSALVLCTRRHTSSNRSRISRNMTASDFQ